MSLNNTSREIFRNKLYEVAIEFIEHQETLLSTPSRCSSHSKVYESCIITRNFLFILLHSTTSRF